MTDKEIDNIEYNADYLFNKIMDKKLEEDMIEFRTIVFLIEETDFLIDQNKKLSHRLLAFAEKYRDIEKADTGTIYSAIRTGASMLKPEKTDILISLLTAGHKIETSLVTIKMIGRIFEAQPPKDVNQYEKLATIIRKIADSLINPYSIMSSESAAQAQLALFALSSMASEQSLEVMTNIIKMKSKWFTISTLHSLNKLKKVWDSQESSTNKNVIFLLNRLIDGTQRNLNKKIELPL